MGEGLRVNELKGVLTFFIGGMYQISPAQFSRSVVTPRTVACQLPCPSPTPRACSDSYPSSWWCHPTISSSIIPFFSRCQSFSASGSFSNESALCIRWPKYWRFSFNISPSNEYSGLISFRMDWLDLLAVIAKCLYLFFSFLYTNSIKMAGKE